jgi:hypothetical protein
MNPDIAMNEQIMRESKIKSKSKMNPDHGDERLHREQPHNPNMKTKLLKILCLTLTASLFLLVPSAPAAPSQTLRGHVPSTVAQVKPTGRLPATNRLHLAVALAPRNRDGLLKLLQDQQDPHSPSYHQYLSLEEFTSRFGPTAQNYQKAMDFAQANGLKVSGTYSNRIILDMEGAVPDVEKALHVTLRTYQHPKEKREFYAPDTEPSLDLAVPLLNITGLDNYSLPHRTSHRKPIQPTHNGGAANGVTPNGPRPDGYSGPAGYAPADLRKAYVPGTTLTGAGQSVGLVEFSVDAVPPFTGGYYDSDLVAYENEFGLPHISVTTVPVSGGLITAMNSGQIECTLDIEMVMAMAPGASIYVFECPFYFNDLLSAMVSYTSIKQFSSSWYGGIALEPNFGGDFLLMEMAAQGQSFFEASGDYDAYTGSYPREADWPEDSPYATVVGGTRLTMNGLGASYASETVWNDYAPPNQLNVAGSGGGISQYYAIPYWQQGISMTANHGSTTQRNVPDVAMVAIGLDAYINGADGGGGGTSASAPLWAGFMALVNQQAASLGNPSAGFINPAIYAIGQGMGNTPYASAFHDTTTGSNAAPVGYPAVAGYDLCTGWGTPAIGLINSLAGGAAAPYHLVVMNTNDSGPGSLRQTISNAVAGAYITFSNSLAGATIRLTSGQLMITNNLTIDASALPGGITLNGNHASRIFQIASVATGRMLALTLTNAYSTGSGGAILNGGVLSLANCTLAGNTGSGSLGGAIGNLGPLTLTGCTFSGNGAGYGGAIQNQGTVCTVQNCTFAGNTASAGGGGAIINSFGATLNLLHCTFTGNSSSVQGGDIFNSGSQVNLSNTILATSTPDDIYNAAGSTNTAGGSNIVQVLVNAGTFSGTNTILAVNPQLAPLGNYGGPTQTRPPMAGSPAIDVAPFTTLLTDQRGFPRVVGPAPDIGAAEFQDASPIVTTAADSGIGSLRYATTYTTNGDYITFATNLSGVTILSSGTLTLNKNLTIDASALPGGITINGNQAGSVFLVTNGNVVLTALTITNGYATGFAGGGGGIRNYGVLTLDRCTLAGNSSEVAGGIMNLYGILVVNESTLTGNSGSYGGGIENLEGAVTVNQSTLTGNSDPSGQAGGVYDYDQYGSITIFNSIIAGNTLPNTAGNGGQAGTTSGIAVQTGVNLTSGNPLLAPLGHYGGPTPTMPPLPGSPAIDGCTNGTTFTTDQRGYPRSIGRAPDIGAVEGVHNPAGPGKLMNVTKLGNGSVSFTLTNYSDMSFTVLASTNLALPFSQWSNLGTMVESPLGSGQYPFIDLNATNYSQRFYDVASP